MVMEPENVTQSGLPKFLSFSRELGENTYYCKIIEEKTGKKKKKEREKEERERQKSAAAVASSSPEGNRVLVSGRDVPYYKFDSTGVTALGGPNCRLLSYCPRPLYRESFPRLSERQDRVISYRSFPRYPLC